MKNKMLFLTAAILFLAPQIFAGANGRFQQKKVGNYKVSISQLYESGLGSLLVTAKGKRIFEEHDIDSHYYFGNNFDGALKGKDIYSAKDITGNGIPNLVISNWSGGVHCCHFLSIFELGKNFKKITTVEANSSGVRLVDLDKDGFPEIEFQDGAIDYLFASFAFSPPGRVVLKFNKDHYELDTKLMKKTLPSKVQMEAMKNKIRKSFEDNPPELPFKFLESMMNLSYTGHFELALKVADETWPSQRPGLSKFKEDFTKALSQSPYWKKF